MTQFIQINQLIYTEVDGETIVVNPESGQFFGLNGVASCIWPLLKTKQSVDSIVEVMVEAMDAPADQCTADVTTFLEQLHRHGLIESTG